MTHTLLPVVAFTFVLAVVLVQAANLYHRLRGRAESNGGDRR